MGKENDVMRDYLSDKERFADLFNANLFEGREIIDAGQLMDGSESYKEEFKSEQMIDAAENPADNDITVRVKDSTTTRYRDIKMRLQSGGVLRVLAIEDQTSVDYTMPWRNMNYDALEYGTQVRNLKRKNTRNKRLKSQAEKLCGLLKTDRLMPTYTICLYHGKELWDGPRSLRDMMDFGEDKEVWEEIFADYHMRLVCINEQEDFSKYQSSLRELFPLLARREDRKALQQLVKENPAYRNIDEETAKVASVLLGNKVLISEKSKTKEGKINMCKALEEWAEESRKEGKREGIVALIELCQEFDLTKDSTVERLMQKFGLEKADALGKVEKYWK